MDFSFFIKLLKLLKQKQLIKNIKNKGEKIMKNKFLLGATKDKELVFGKFEITTRNNFQEFLVSFNIVIPFDGDNFDLEEYFEDWVEGLDKEYLYDLCEQNYCAPQELVNALVEDCVDVRDAMDCSLYPKVVEVDGVHYYFESSGCGQYDTRENMEFYTNKEAYDLLIELRDKYDLKEIDEEGIEKAKKIEKLLVTIDEKQWIADYIQKEEL